MFVSGARIRELDVAEEKWFVCLAEGTRKLIAGT